MTKKTWRQWLQSIGPGGIVIRVFLVWFILAFILYPNISMLISIFFKNGQFTTDVFRKFLSSERAMRSLQNSFVLAVSMVFTVNIVGTLLVFFTEYFDIKGAKIINIAYSSTLVYGGVVLCTGYKYIYGASGLMTKFLLLFFPNLNPNWFTGYGAVLFIMTFAATSNHILFLSNSLRGIDYQTVEAAKNMGASFKTIFSKIIFPALKPNFFALTILTFLTGLSAMSAPLIVGGTNFQTINPMIMAFAKTTVSRDIGTLLAIILGIATMILLSISNKLEKGGNYISISKTKSKLKKEKITNPVFNILAHGVAYILFLIYAIPILLVILYSFTDSQTILSGEFTLSSLTIENYWQLFTKLSSLRPYAISIGYSIAAAVLVTVLVTMVARILHTSKSKFSVALEYSMLIPWLLPSTLIALGLMVTYDAPRLIMGNKVLIGTVFILLFAYIIAKIPFSLRMIKASFFSLDKALEESAKSMGAKPHYTFRRVLLPIILPVLVSVIVLNFNSLLAEYDMTVFLFHPLMQPLGPVIKAASDETATINAKAMTFVYSVILMIISTIALVISFRLQGSGIKRKTKIKKNRVIS